VVTVGTMSAELLDVITDLHAVLTYALQFDTDTTETIVTDMDTLTTVTDVGSITAVTSTHTIATTHTSDLTGD
jgi:hypothetical protein